MRFEIGVVSISPVSVKVVEVLAVISKQEAEIWLAKEATPTKEGGAGKGEG
jgi:hypothetical protein